MVVANRDGEDHRGRVLSSPRGKCVRRFRVVVRRLSLISSGLSVGPPKSPITPSSSTCILWGRQVSANFVPDYMYTLVQESNVVLESGSRSRRTRRVAGLSARVSNDSRWVLRHIAVIKHCFILTQTCVVHYAQQNSTVSPPHASKNYPIIRQL